MYCLTIMAGWLLITFLDFSFSRATEMDITMIGLQNAGKTSLLRVLAVSDRVFLCLNIGASRVNLQVVSLALLTNVFRVENLLLSQCIPFSSILQRTVVRAALGKLRSILMNSC